MRYTDDSLTLFLCTVQKEVGQAREKFPGNRHMMTALTEEVGELAQALIDDHRLQQGNAGGTIAREGSSMNVYMEAVQVACMAARVALEGDADFTYPDVLKTIK